MKFHFILFIFLISPFFMFAQQPAFNDYFLPKQMRVDYMIAGKNGEMSCSLVQLKEEPFWGGSLKNLVDKFNLGSFKFEVFDSKSNRLIYSRGFSTLFREWLDTPEAKLVSRSFYETLVFPFPKNKVKVVVSSRDKKNIFHPIFETLVDPSDYFIVKENIALPYKTIYGSGNSNEKVDVVVIPEGYTAAEMDKFHRDADRFVGYFFKVSPFKEMSDKFKFWTVDAASLESGTDVPGKGVWKKTVLNSHFYTFDMERYLTTQDINTVRNLAAAVPYDQIYILVNTNIYGGGGVYNYYNLCMSDNDQAEEVFTHEFGHAFADLGDEYEYGYDKAEDIYDLSVEPYVANLTTLANFESKWKGLVDAGTPIPTPPVAVNKDKVGAFEGAGYVKTKIYRPAYNCKMRSNAQKTFCPVCLKAVTDMIQFYCD